VLPLRRARQTAEIVPARLQLPVAAQLEDLREVTSGTLMAAMMTGMAGLRSSAGPVRSGDLGWRFPGGESGDELVARIGRVLRVIARWAGT
jgi:broad specificity phosphatase PhoE